MTTPIEKLREYGYELPRPKPPVASYVPVTRTGNIALRLGPDFLDRDGVVTGLLGDTMNVVQGGNAAELAALNVLSQIVHTAASTSSQRQARAQAHRLRRLDARLLRAAPGRQRRLQPHRRGARRQGQARALGHRPGGAAARRGGRGRGDRRSRRLTHVRHRTGATSPCPNSLKSQVRQCRPVRTSTVPSPIADCMTAPRASSRTAAPAFEAAIERGFTIECDVQLSSDGVADHLPRRRSRAADRRQGPFVRDRTMAELTAMPLLGQRGRRPAAALHRVPRADRGPHAAADRTQDAARRPQRPRRWRGPSPRRSPPTGAGHGRSRSIPS